MPSSEAETRTRGKTGFQVTQLTVREWPLKTAEKQNVGDVDSVKIYKKNMNIEEFFCLGPHNVNYWFLQIFQFF